MTYTKDKNTYAIRIFRDEEVMDVLTRFCVEENIYHASFTGIGATKSSTFGYYDLEKREYFFETYDQLMEVISMNGNVSLLEGKPFLHVHAAFGDTDLKVYGGHVKNMTAGVTIEIHFTAYDSKVERAYDAEVGLNLFNLPCQFA
jgi:hypothetical protein